MCKEKDANCFAMYETWNCVELQEATEDLTWLKFVKS